MWLALENTTMFKLLYQQDAFPVFQNRMYESKEEAIKCPNEYTNLRDYLYSDFKLSRRNKANIK